MSSEAVGASRLGQRARELASARLAGYRVTSVRSLGSGEDHAAVEVNGELVVRFAGSGDVAAIGSSLGALLAALRRVPLAAVADLVEVDDTAPAVWRDEATELYAEVRSEVPAGHRPAVERFLAAAVPDGAVGLVLAHNDLGIEHVLVDEVSGRVTGVIDWSDAALADPARDLALILRDLGPGALRAAADRLPGAGDDGRLGERVWFHARCAAIEDLAYGVRTGRREYASKSLDALGWLFARRTAGSRPAGAANPDAPPGR